MILDFFIYFDFKSQNQFIAEENTIYLWQMKFLQFKVMIKSKDGNYYENLNI